MDQKNSSIVATNTEISKGEEPMMIQLPEAENESPVFQVLIIVSILAASLVWVVLGAVRLVWRLYADGQDDPGEATDGQDGGQHA